MMSLGVNYINFIKRNLPYMHIFQVAFFAAGALYAIFEAQQLILYFFMIVGIYMAISAFYPGGKNVSNRKKIMLSTWSEPSEGVIQCKVPIRVQKAQAVIDRYAEEGKIKLTLTHFVLKACGALLHEGKDINGKLVFGKFVQHQTADVSCLVDIDGGKDLAMILVRDIGRKGVEDIAEYVKNKADKIKKGQGDAQHKKRTKSADYFPAFLVSIMIQVGSFLSCKLGVSIPALALKKDQFGSGCVTSLGMLGFEDALAPFSGFMNCSFFASINAVTDSPVVEDGQIKVGKVMNVNFGVDHRYVDGGRAKTFVKSFKAIFENPQKYLKAEESMEKEKVSGAQVIPQPMVEEEGPKLKVG